MTSLIFAFVSGTHYCEVVVVVIHVKIHRYHRVHMDGGDNGTQPGGDMTNWVAGYCRKASAARNTKSLT